MCLDTLDVQATFLRFYAGLRDFMEPGIQSGFSLGAFSIGRQNRALGVQGAAARKETPAAWCALWDMGRSRVWASLPGPRAEAGEQTAFCHGSAGASLSPRTAFGRTPLRASHCPSTSSGAVSVSRSPRASFTSALGQNRRTAPRRSPRTPPQWSKKGKKDLAGKVVAGKPGGQGRGDGPAPVGRTCKNYLIRNR